MSVEASTWAWKQPVKGNAKLVLLAIADHADPVGVCWPGQEGLAKKCGITDRAVRDQMTTLESKSLISREPRYREGGGRTSDLIRLSMEANSSGKPTSKPEDFVEQTGNHASGLNRKHASGEPPVEPPVEPSEDPPTPLLAVLWPVADLKNCKRPTAEAIERAIGDFPDRDAMAAARDLAYWAEHGNGARRQIKNLASTFRAFLKRADSKPSAPTSSNGRSRWGAWVDEHLPELAGYARDLAVGYCGTLDFGRHDVTVEAVRSYVEQRTGGSE